MAKEWSVNYFEQHQCYAIKIGGQFVINQNGSISKYVPPGRQGVSDFVAELRELARSLSVD